MIKKDKIFISDGLSWTVEVSRLHEDRDRIAYAVCPKAECRVRLNFDGVRLETSCIKCGEKYSLKKDYETIRDEVNAKYYGSKLWMSDVINLDLLPTKLAAGDEDENYWIQVRIGQKNGKRTAVVYVGEKVSKQSKTDYAQIFIDIDDEQLRFDKGNKHPMKLLARLEANFPDTKVEISKSKKD